MPTAIKVENLSKRYIIGHEKQEKYGTLRDSLAHSVRSFIRRLRHPLQPNIEETELEKFWALKDIDLEIKQGDRVGVIGRNGAGKSTLLKILSRITAPTTGKVTINGRVAGLLEVGTGFHPELSGRENIYLNGAILGMRKAEIKKNFDEIVAFSEVEKFLDTPVKRYSSGMYVRLAFAVAAHLEPEILIVDEVLAVGDSGFQQKCIGKLNSISNQDKTIVFVSHNMTALKNLCDKSIYLERGRIVDYSVTIDIVQKYQLSFFKKNFNKFEALSSLLDPNLFLKNVQLFNSKDELTTIIESGSIIILKLKFSSVLSYSNFQLSIGFDSLGGERVGYLTTSMTDAKLALSPGLNVINCTIPKLPLVPGEYFISIKAIRKHDTFFWLPKYLKFTVVDGDFFGTGKLILERWVGNHYIEHFWN